MKTPLNPIPLSLYIHFPWCIRKCPYCDFNSHKLNTTLAEDEYIEALIADLRHDLTLLKNPRPLSSIFMGGGTPSLFSGASINRLLSAISSLIPFQDNIEITLEANPGTVEQQQFKAYKAAGINRLSLGIQSFNDLHLKSLGRIHDASAAHKALDSAIEAGFNNINLDLMYGLPKQTVSEAISDLTTAILLAPTHISWYQLTLEPNTLFAKFPPALPDEEILYEQELAGKSLLQDNGFQQYEVSAYAKIILDQPISHLSKSPIPEYSSVNNLYPQSQHNLNYWLFGDYLGIGAGAHSKLTDTTSDEYQIMRLNKMRQPNDYLDKNKTFIAESKLITAQEAVFEFMLNALRLQQPLPKQLFQQHTGQSLATYETILDKAQSKGFITQTPENITVTDLGKRFLNDLTALFLHTSQ